MKTQVTYTETSEPYLVGHGRRHTTYTQNTDVRIIELDGDGPRAHAAMTAVYVPWPPRTTGAS